MDDQPSIYQDLLRAVAEGTIEAVVAAVYCHLGQPIAVYDADSVLLCQMPDVELGCEAWDRPRTAGAMPLEFVDTFTRTGFMQQAYQAEASFIREGDPLLGVPVIVTRLARGDNIYGYCGIYYPDGPPPAGHLGLADEIGRALSLVLEKQADTFAAADSVESLFLSGLCRGRLRSPDLEQWLPLVQPTLPGSYRIAITRLAADSDPLYADTYLKTAQVELSRRHAILGHSAVAGGNLLILFTGMGAPTAKGLADRLLSEAASRHGLSAGVSFDFADLAASGAAVQQARYALGLQGSDPGVLNYVDCVLRQMAETIRDHLPEQSWTHPGMTRLRQHDQARGTAYHGTLVAYLLTSCDSHSTAAALFIHRNTLAYRLRRIAEIAELNLSDPSTLAYLYWSALLESQG
jgi:hypothetical protein